MLRGFYHGFSFIRLRPSTPIQAIAKHGYLSVDLFLVLSGFVMALNYRDRSRFNYRDFLGRRIARIYPLYVLATLVSWLLARAHWMDDSVFGGSPHILVYNLLMVQVWGLSRSLDGPCWSVSAEWAAYLLFPVLLWLVFRTHKAGAFAMMAVCIAALATLYRVPYPMDNHAVFDRALPDHFLGLLRCLPEFCLGLVSVRLLDTKAGQFIRTRSWMGSALLAAILGCDCFPTFDIAVVVLFVPFLLTLLNGESRVSQVLGSAPLRYLGTISFSIYLIHEMVAGVIARSHSFLSTHHVPHAQTVAMLPAFALILWLSSLTYTFIEEPARKFLQRVFRGELSFSRPRLTHPVG